MFLCKARKEKDEAAPIEGININVNPDQIIDSGMKLVKIPPAYKEQLINGLKHFVSGFLTG